jgi:hypothetical protein
MSANEITITKARNKTREDWMIAEQYLQRAIMDSVGLAIRHIIAPPPLCFQNMMPIDIINTVRAHNGKTTTRTVRRLDEILAEKLDNVRNFKPMQQRCRMPSPLDRFWYTHGRNHANQTIKDLHRGAFEQTLDYLLPVLAPF